jgi:chorismate mutase
MFGVEKPIIVAGPCSAESEIQIYRTFKELSKDQRVNFLRAGVWKPRTRPNSFEGKGEEALQWIVSASKQVQLPSIIEVANARHVESALKAGINAIWIGARTTVNPFTVQEIADSIAGVDIPVLIKNPVNPDVQLWLGAIERIQKAGVKQIFAVHRGFSVYNHSIYRNVPNWEIPMSLREFMPELPILCDPSHICGNRHGLQEVSQKSMDLNYDGLMIETHFNPAEALSDSNQQITPSALFELLDKLTIRNKYFSESTQSVIEKIRSQIASMDDEIFNRIAQRMKLSEKIGAIKKENHIMIYQHDHWKKVIENRLSQEKELDLSYDFLRKVMDAIHQESIQHQTKVMNTND